MSIAAQAVPPYDMPRTRLTEKLATRPIEASSRPYKLHFLTFTRDNKSCRKQQSAQQGGPHSVRRHRRQAQRLLAVNLVVRTIDRQQAQAHRATGRAKALAGLQTLASA